MSKFNIDDAFALADELDNQREWADTPKEFAAGANTMLSSALGSLDKSKLGDIARLLKGKPTKSDVEFARLYQKDKAEQLAKEYLDAGTIFQDGQEVLNEGSQYWLDKRSPKAKRVDEYIEQGTGFTDTIGRYAENPAAIVGHTVRNLPQLMPLLVLKNAPVSAQMNLGNVYQGEVGGQQAREQSLQDSKAQNALDRFNSANEAQGLGSAISQAAGTIGLRGDTAMLNLLTGQGTKGLTTKSLKEAGKHLGLNVAEETIDEGGSPFATNIAAKQNYDKGRDVFKDVGKQAAAGAVIGAGMGSVQAGSLAIFGDDQNTNNQNNLAQAIISTIPKKDIPKQYQNAFNAFEDAKQAEAQAQAAYEANPTPESEEALAQATDARLKANNQFSQYDAAFKQTFTEQEQQDLLSNDLKGIAARAKLEQEAKQVELNSKAEQEALAKAQRANMVKGLAAYADNESVLINEVNQLGLDDTQKELLLREVFAERKNAKAKPQQTQAKTPLELAVDEHFDAKGNRKPSVMSSDVADKHKVSLNELLPAIAKRNNDIKIQKAQAEKQAKQQAQLDEDAKAFQQSQAKLEADAKRKAQAQQKAKEQGLKQDAITEQQQLENTLANFAAENDTDSMLSMLEGYDKAEADRLFNNAFKTVETRTKEAEKATKAKESEAAKQAQAKQKQSAFNADMSALYESNPNATYNDWKNVGKKHGVTSAIDLANAWASAKSNKSKQKNEQKPKNIETLALPSPNTVMVADAQGNVTPITENNIPKKQRNADVSVPSGLSVDVSNAANTQRDRGVGSYSGSASSLIVRQDGKPFPTEQVAQQALTNKTTNKTKAKKNEPVISKDTHTVVPVDGGYAIAPVEQVEPVVQQEAKVEPKQEAAPEQTDDITGQYTHSRFPDATATVTKTDKGYDVDWGDEVQSFTGKNALEKTKSVLAKEGFNKGKPKGDYGVTVDQTPNKPVSPTNTTQTTPETTLSTTGEQIAEAMDKTAQAITEAAHNKVVERVKNGEEIVYKQPAAIERVKQDERYQVEINDKGHAVVKNVKDNNGNWVKPDMSNQSTQAEQRVEKKTEIKDEPKAYGKNVVSVYLTQGGQDGLVISKNEDKYHYTGKFGAGSGHSHADMLKIVNGIKSSKRGVKLGYGVEFELVQQSEQKAEQLKQDKPIKKSPLKATASKSEFNKAFGVNESKIDEIAKDFEIKSQNESELNPQESKKPTKKETPIQGKDIWMEVEFIAGNKSKEFFYHNRMADPNKPFNTEAEAIADWESKTEEQSNSTIEETKQPTKKERLLIKIDDELDAALDDFAAIFKEQGKRLSSGVDPVIMGKVLAIGMKASTLYLAKGAVKFAVWAENIVAALSSKGVPKETVQPYLKGLYLASKAESSPEIRQQMDKEDDVYDFDFDILNVGQEEAADSIEKTQTTKKTLTDLFYDHLKKGTLPENNAALRKMVSEFDGKEVDNYRLKEAQEMLEAAMARYSRDVVTSNKNGDASTFNQLVDSYNKQPNLNIRTSTSVENQAYSTPAPLAFVAAKMANIGKNTTVYEPTAGNGMLLITALPENATVNEMEGTRFNNLKEQGFNAHQGDALKAIENGVVKPASQDAIITNPPFGSIKENGKTVKIEFDGYKIGKIDHLIAAEALKAMKPNGTAAIIIGADMVQGGISTDDRIFFNWLYSNYNVVSHFEVDGKLYSRQGASWPVRVIIVHGKQESNSNSPVTGAIPRYDNWKDVYDQYIKMVVASNNGGLSVGTRGSDNRIGNDTATTQPIDGVETTQTGARGRNTTRNNDDVDGASTRNVSNRTGNRSKQLRDSDNVQRFDERTNVQDNLAVGDNRDTGGATRDNSGVGRGSKPNEHTGKDVAVLSDADNSFQVKYTPASSRKDEGVLIPINMRQPLMESLLTLEDSVGDIDKYAAKELGYRNVEQLHDALMGLQVDSVASAIYQIKEKNKGIIIADQTGIGKGRQAAAIIRWAILNGHTPVFVTVKPQLFTDMYGDLSDIGSNDVKPFIVNTGESISGKDGQKLHKTKSDAKHRKEIEDIAADGVLPDEYNAVFITYSQINKANNQQRLLSSLSGNAIFILDESHNAGGASATGLFVQDLLKEAKGVVYLSATFAKRPDNMPLYFKTDMGMAVGETSELSAAVIQGGLPLQTVISNSLVKAGQLFRRERSYNGVSIETKVDSQNKLAHEKLSDEATKALRAIVAADKMFHNTYFARLEKAMEEQGQQARAAGNKAEKSVNHHEFSSVVHNFIRQMLLGLKVDTAANEAIAALKRGEKPLIALENTMGSFLNEYVAANGLKEGDSLGNFGYRNVLSRALYRTRAVTIKDRKGKETRKEVGLDELDSETRAAYNAAQKIIDSLDISIPASPIDWMRNRLEAAGYSVAEITGRNMAVDYSTKTPTVSQVPLSEQNDKVGTTRMFNNGELDAIILNVAGSTGISLHASEKFKDKRKRHMIVAQPAQDINIFMQMLGRIHRTGQVILPKYTILSLDLPTEKRPTAVLNKKMKSLNANTSSNTESATSIVSLDMLNKYGDKIVASYLSENQDVARKIGMEVHGDTSTSDTHDDFAKKATGRFALLPVSEQKRIYDEIEPQYAALISYLDETGQNELEPKTIDFDAELKLEAVAVPATDQSTPFGQEAIYGEYKVKPQGKPMSVDEVKALIVKNIGEGVMPAQHTQKLITDGQLAFDSFINTLNEKYKAAENEEEAGIIQKNIVNQQAVFENTKSFIDSHRVGSIWQIDIKGDIYNAVITNVKSTFKKGGHGNPFAQSKILISLAVNGELRTVTVPMTEFSRIEVTKYYGTAQDALKPREGDAGLAKIITGNLLAGYANLVGSDGRVISFTKKDGTTEQGILLPKKFNFKDNVRQDFAIKDANDVFKLLKSGVTDILKTGVASRKGDIRIVHNTNTGGITIYTPKSKSTGGKWFLNKKLIDVVGDFVSSGNMMMVNVPSKKAIDALSIVIEKTPLYVLPSQAEATKELLGYYDGQVNLKSGSNPQDSDSKPKFSQSSTIGDRTITQVRDKLIKRFGKRIVELLESKGILKIHQSMKTLPKGVLDMARGTEDAAYYNGVVHLIADNLTDENIIPAFVHDLSGHKGFQEMMSPKAYELIMQQFDRLVAQGNAIAIKAKQRAEKAEKDTARQQDEYIPYLLTEQEKAQFATSQERNAVKRLIDHIVRAVKGWVVRHLSKYDTTYKMSRRVAESLTPADIFYMAERMVGEIAVYGGDNNNRPKFSKTEQSQFDQLLAKADKMIAEQGKLLAPNGKPSKLNRVQWAQVRTDNFKAWFGDWENDPENASQVIDSETKEPMVVYHGTNADFNVFDFGKISENTGNNGHYGFGIYFSIEELEANTYGNYILPTFLNIKSPVRNSTSSLEPFLSKFGYKRELKTIDKKWLVDEIKKKDSNAGILAELYADGYNYDDVWAKFEASGGIYQSKINLDDVGDVFSNIDASLGFYDLKFIEDNIGEIPEDKKIYDYKKEPNILDITDRGIAGQYFTNIVKDDGRDGVIAGSEYVVFTPTQIKSAISNNGEFSPTNPDIRFSRAEDKAKAAKDYVLDSVRISNQAKANLHAKAELGWWSKTIGTQLNTAKKFKDFDRVYKLLQRLLQHQSSDVMDALEVAPTLLEKLDDWQDLKNQVKAIGRNAWQGLKHKVITDAVTDRMAVAKVIFSETLAKKPLSQAELEQKLTPQQLKIYEEARAAINVSLKNTAKSEIIRSLLQNDVINFDTVEKLLNQQTGFDAFIDEMLENVGARISNAQEELSQAETDVEKQAIKDELKRLEDMYNSISDVNAKVYQLIDEAYAPLMRFGDYALTMRDKTTGKVLSFMMFESKAERNRMVNYLGTEYGDTVTLETDTMSTEDFKMFKGVTPETVALFAKELGLDKNEAYQGYLKLAIPATSALTRRIKRKGTAGYNEDIQRVVSAFVMSNARYSSKNIYLDKVNQAHSEIDSGTSVRDQAKKMIDNTIDPADTIAWLRDLLFVWYLGGSVMFAFLNMTQPFMQTLPMLSQYVDIEFARKQVFRGIGVAGAAMATGNAPKGYEAEYKRAVQEGIVDPQNTFMLTGLERGGTGTTSKTWTATKHLLGIFAQVSESLNRKAVFVASLEVAKAKGDTWLKQKGFDSAYDFAVDVIAQTQGVYNKANRSNWAHSQLGAPLLVFKQFSINYVEQMVRMWKNQNEGEEGKKAVLLAMMMLFSLAGGMGLPFIKDIFDGSETIAAFMGNPVNIEREMRLMGKQYLGETTTGALMDGWLNKLVIGEVLGADVQSRTGMGNLIPATAYFNSTLSSEQKTSEFLEAFGAAGGLGSKLTDALQLIANDEYATAFKTASPRFISSAWSGVEMMTTGKTMDSKGRTLFNSTLSEGLVKFLDSQPVRMAELSRARGLEYDDIAIQRSKIDYYRKKWIKAAQKEDDEAIEQIEQDIEDWNENNEKYPVIFDRQRAYQSANKNEMTWGEREERTQKGMDWLNEERPDWLNE